MSDSAKPDASKADVEQAETKPATAADEAATVDSPAAGSTDAGSAAAGSAAAADGAEEAKPADIDEVKRKFRQALDFPDPDGPSTATTNPPGTEIPTPKCYRARRMPLPRLHAGPCPALSPVPLLWRQKRGQGGGGPSRAVLR